MASLHKIAIQAEKLKLRELRRLDDTIHGLIARLVEAEKPATVQKEGREVIKYRRHGSVTYQLEYISCGKNCKNCGKHGPYWYAYWSQGGKTRSKYIGKKLTRDRQRETQRERNRG